FLREVTRLGPPGSTRLLDRLRPLVARAAGYLEPESDAGRMGRLDPRLLLLAANSMGRGLATEVEVLRAFRGGLPLASPVRRRDELLALLRASRHPASRRGGRSAGRGEAGAAGVAPEGEPDQLVDQRRVVEPRGRPELRVHRDRREAGDRVDL